MINDFELYSDHVESPEMEKQYVLNTKNDYVKYNRKGLP